MQEFVTPVNSFLEELRGLNAQLYTCRKSTTKSKV